MKVYTNEFNEIVSLEYKEGLNEIEIPTENPEEDFFYGKCNAFILGYKYGFEETDEYCETEDGIKTENKVKYLVITPYKSLEMLEAIQAQYESDKEITDALEAKNTELELQLTDAQLALCEQYEENLALQEELTNTQLALCEIYEEMGV